jgi:hypothetical protein
MRDTGYLARKILRRAFADSQNYIVRFRNHRGHAMTSVEFVSHEAAENMAKRRNGTVHAISSKRCHDSSDVRHMLLAMRLADKYGLFG